MITKTIKISSVKVRINLYDLHLRKVFLNNAQKPLRKKGWQVRDHIGGDTIAFWRGKAYHQFRKEVIRIVFAAFLWEKFHSQSFESPVTEAKGFSLWADHRWHSSLITFRFRREILLPSLCSWCHRVGGRLWQADGMLLLVHRGNLEPTLTILISELIWWHFSSGGSS